MTPRSQFSFARLMLSTLLLMVAAQTYGGESIDGSWELNLAKSKFSPGPPPQRQTRIYSTDGDMQTIMIDEVDAKGAQVANSSSYRLDGKDYPVKGSVLFDTVAMTKVDANTARGTTKRGGQIATQITRKVSDDGKTLTVTTKGTTPDGQPFSNVLVFDRT